ncbi:MAG: hypothetical protein ACOVOA_17805 [Allorhizobium sp.]
MAMSSNVPATMDKPGPRAAWPRLSAWTRRLAVSLLVAVLALGPALPSPALAAGAETQLRNNLPGALRGNRVAVREVAKAIVKIGPRSFKSAAQIRPLIRAEALRGSSSAANAYGIMLQYGIGGPKRPKEAATWYARGGLDGNVGASKNGALAYALGWGVQRSTKRANQLLAKVPADQRSRKMLEISKALMQPGREEPDVALYWLERAVALDPAATLNAASVYRDLAKSMPGGEERLAEWLKPLAEKGNDKAALILARQMEATGRSEDLVAASDLYLKAAESDPTKAYEALGRLLTNAPAPLSAEILARLEEKAKQGVVPAAVALGTHLLFSAPAAPENREKGLTYLEQAARSGDAETQYRLAMILLGDAENAGKHELARAYLALSAASGNEMAAMAAKQFGEITVADARLIVTTAKN